MKEILEILLPYLKDLTIVGLTMLIAWLKKKYDIKRISTKVSEELDGRVSNSIREDIIAFIKQNKKRNGNG